LEVGEAKMQKPENHEDQEEEGCRTAAERADVLSQFHLCHRSLRTR